MAAVGHLENYFFSGFAEIAIYYNCPVVLGVEEFILHIRSTI